MRAFEALRSWIETSSPRHIEDNMKHRIFKVIMGVTGCIWSWFERDKEHPQENDTTSWDNWKLGE